MTHTYNISGMTCSGCQAKVQKLLSGVSGVTSVNIDLASGQAKITMDSHVSTARLKETLSEYPKYQLIDALPDKHDSLAAVEEETKSWVETYKPILLIFAYITGITLLVEIQYGEMHWMRWMNHFMAGFFLIFSFFKFLNLKAFAETYSMYDIVARKWPAWGYFYAFAELGLGVAFLTSYKPLFTNAATLIIMSVSIVGVLQSVLNKRKIKCACLGAVFNLPMSTVTIIEDLLMIIMSLVMLIKFL